MEQTENLGGGGGGGGGTCPRCPPGSYAYANSTMPSQPTITSSKHSERVLVSNAQACSLLLKYAGISKDHKHISCPTQLSEAEFRELCQLTRKDIASLAAFIKSLRKEYDKKSPPQYRQFFFPNLHDAVQHVGSSRHAKIGRFLKLCTSFCQHR